MSKERQDNPFLPNWQLSEDQEKMIDKALNTPEGKAMMKDIVEDINNMILEEVRKQIKEGKIK